MLKLINLFDILIFPSNLFSTFSTLGCLQRKGAVKGIFVVLA